MLSKKRLGLLALPVTLSVAVAACGSDGSTFDDGTGGDRDGDLNGGAFGDGGAGGDGSGNGGADGGPVCATGQAATKRQPVYMNIILDGSRSMDGHGPVADGCDTGQSHGDATTCFVAGARELDPLAPTRDNRVCHDESTPASSCPAFVGMTGKKWIAARGALTEFFNGLTEDPKLGVGMYLFSSSVAKNANEIDVPVAAATAAHKTALVDRIKPGTWPSGGTPLKASIDGQSALLQAFQPAPPLEAGGKRVLLLVTDGVPYSSDESAIPANKVAVREAVEKARTEGVLTFVVGIGNVEVGPNFYDETFLSSLAQAGGAAPAGCNPAWDGQAPAGTPCHLQITPGAKTAQQIKADLKAAIEQIAEAVISCELPLDRSGGKIDAKKVNVVYTDGAGSERQLPADAANGWSLDNPADPAKVTLHGTSCEALKADAKATVRIVIGCATGTSVVK